MARPRKQVVDGKALVANAEGDGTRVRLCLAINRIIEERKMTQKVAAEVMGVPQPTVSNLLRDQLKKFSVERLLRLVAALGQAVVIEIRPLEKKGAGRVRVVGAA